MSNPQSTATRRERDLRDSAKHRKHRSMHAEKACPNPPAQPQSVTLSFQAQEEKTTLDFSPKVKWAPVTRDEQGHLTDIDNYVIQMVATSGGAADSDGMGPPVEFEDGKPRLRELHKKPPKQSNSEKGHGTQTDDLSIVWPVVPRPRTWYWQARVAAVDHKGCQGDWSPWTNQKLPWNDTRTLPPTPTGLTMSFDTVERTRHDRYRAVVTFNEVQNWDIPGGDHQDDVAGYAVELQSGTNHSVASGGVGNTTWNGPDREKHKEAKTNSGDATCNVVFEKISKHYFYRARVRTIDRFNRRGNWSDWYPGPPLDSIGVTPSDTSRPPAPTNIDLNMNSHQARITWDEVIDPETGILHQDVAWFEVQMSKNSGFGTINYKDTEVLTHHKVFKLDKPKGNWFARVRAIDTAGNQSAWSANATDTPRKPPAVPNVRVDFIQQEPKKWDKVKARVRWDAVQEQSDDIAHYVIELESGDVVNGHPQDTYTKDGNRWTGHVRAPEVVDDLGTEQADGTQYGANQTDHPYQWMHRAKRGHWYRARVRAVDKDGQVGDWGPNPPDGWSGSGPWRQKCTPANAKVLKAPVAPKNLPTVKGIGLKWTHPTDDDGFPDETIDYFQVQVSTSQPAATGFPAGTVLEDDNYVHARRALYAVDTGWADTTGPYYAAVRSYDNVGNSSDWVYETDATGAPKAITPTNTVTTPITDPTLFGGQLRPPQAGATLPTLPNAKYPQGTAFYLTVDNTVSGTVIKGTRFYWAIDGNGGSGIANTGWDTRVFLGDANGQVDGTTQVSFRSITADRIRGGEITANEMAANLVWSKDFILSGVGAFRTDVAPNARIEMSNVANQGGRDKISFINASGGSIAFQPFRDLSSGGTTRDNVDLVWFGNQTSGTGGSGLRWGGAANFRLVNNGTLQIGDPGKNAFPGGAGIADPGTVRMFWDTSQTPNKLVIVNPNGKKANITTGNFV